MKITIITVKCKIKTECRLKIKVKGETGIEDLKKNTKMCNNELQNGGFSIIILYKMKN